jgi:hypothetical protein
MCEHTRMVDTNKEVQRILISKKEAAQALGGVCVRTVEYLAAQKAIATRKVGGRTMVLYSSLLSFARRGTPTIEKPPRKTPKPEPSSLAVTDAP